MKGEKNTFQTLRKETLFIDHTILGETKEVTVKVECTYCGGWEYKRQGTEGEKNIKETLLLLNHPIMKESKSVCIKCLIKLFDKALLSPAELLEASLT